LVVPNGVDAPAADPNVHIVRRQVDALAEREELLFQALLCPRETRIVARERAPHRSRSELAAAQLGPHLVHRDESQVLGFGQGAPQLLEPDFARDVEQSTGRWGNGQAPVPDPLERPAAAHAYGRQRRSLAGGADVHQGRLQLEEAEP